MRGAGGVRGGAQRALRLSIYMFFGAGGARGSAQRALRLRRACAARTELRIYGRAGEAIESFHFARGLDVEAAQRDERSDERNKENECDRLRE